MSIKKKFQWVTIFTLLSLFSFFAFGQIFGPNTATAFAKTAAEKLNLQEGDGVVVMHSDENSEEDPKGFMERLVRLIEGDELCKVTQVQLDGLSADYDTQIEDVELSDGTMVPVAEVEGVKLTKQELKDYLEQTSDEELDCTVAQRQNIFYLLFAAAVS